MSKQETTDVFYEHAMIRPKKTWLMKKLGFKYKDSRQWEFKWGSFTKEWGTKFEIVEFDTDHDYDHLWSITFSLIWGSFWIRLPKWLPTHHFDDEMQGGIRKWGFHYSNDGRASLHLSWGKKSKFLDVPWTWDHVRSVTLMKDGTWQTPPDWNSTEPTREEFEAQIATETYPYTYLLKRGEFQNVTATVKVSEMEWRRKWIKKLPIFKFIKRTIDITFSSEVGEKSGSWKGGCIGTSFQMNENETVKECLKRMERTRKF